MRVFAGVDPCCPQYRVLKTTRTAQKIPSVLLSMDKIHCRMCGATVYEISRLGRLTSLPGEYPCQESSHGAFRGWGWKVELSLLLFLLEHGEQPLLTLCRILFPLPRVCKLAFESIDSLLVEFDNF